MPADPPHAYYDMHGVDKTIAISALGIWTDVVDIDGGGLWSKHELHNIDSLGDKIQITKAGHYYGAYSLSFSGGNGKVYGVHIAHNTSDTLALSIQGFAAANTEGTAASPFFLKDVEVGDSIGVQIQNRDDATDAVIEAGTLWIRYFHPND